MSRQIDITKPLSDEDREYLVSRARHADLRLNAELTSGEKAPEPTPIDGGNTGDVNPFEKDDGSDLVTGNHPDERTLTPAQEADVSQTADGDEDEGDDYDEMSKADLEAEAEERGLSKSGNKADIIARLREDDEAE